MNSTLPLVSRYFSDPNVHPFNQIEWSRRDAEISKPDGSVVFSQKDMEFPASWSDIAVNIVAQKYFKGKMGTPEREFSARQMISRVAKTIARWGIKDGYFGDTDESAETAKIFEDELTYLLINQYAAFNSPVWFNVGVPNTNGAWCWDDAKNKAVPVTDDMEKPQVSACFILSVDDTMESILQWYVQEGRIFTNGSGSGVNLSSIREEDALLSGGGRASGPLSFMRPADAEAGTIKSGGKTRRAAKMVILNASHPDIEKFIWCKAKEEKVAKDLISLGYNDRYDAADGAYSHVWYQNANNSIRVTDEFMQAVQRDEEWSLKSVNGGFEVKRLKARDLLRQAAEAAHTCGCPGIQYDTTINHWNVAADRQRINASNPCCFVGETLVDTSEGRLRIDQLELMSRAGEVLPYAYSWDLNHSLPVLRPIRRVWRAGNTRKLVEVVTDKGVTLRCTPEHRFLTYSGAWVEAQNLTSGTRLRKIARGSITQRSDRRYIMHRETNAVPNGCQYQSRFVWEQVNGAVPDGFEVHHLNENPTDDRLSNLSLKPCEEHDLIHSVGSANPRYLTISDESLLEIWEAIESEPKKTWKSSQAVTPARWNAYIRQNNLLGLIPTAASPSKGGRIQGMTWEDFAVRMESQKSLANDTVLSVCQIDMQSEVPVYDMEVEGVHNFAVTNQHDTSKHTLVVHNSEYMFLDDTACNLASLNLKKFLKEDGFFDVESFLHAVETITLAQEILVDNGGYPTQAIAARSHEYRTLGLGFANLGTLLMLKGFAYDSDEGRTLAAQITALMTGQAYLTSTRIAEIVGPFPDWKRCKGSAIKVLSQHKDAVGRMKRGLMTDVADDLYLQALERSKKVGFRNAQVTVLAPTGTIGFLMDCETTGIEPDISLVKFKALAGGGSIAMVNPAIADVLQNLGYTQDQISSIVKFVNEKNTVEGSVIKREHVPIFDTAFGPRPIHWKGHVRMMAAVQPFLSGAISKTVNMPADSTVDDVMNAYIEGWELGLKALAIYRDGSKGSQPVTTKEEGSSKQKVETKPYHRKLNGDRPALVHEFQLGGHKGYLTVGLYEDGTPGEIFIDINKEGSTVSGLMDAFAIQTSFALQHGVPLEKMVEKFSFMRFDPAGFTQHPEIRQATSLVDYIFRWLAFKFLKKENPDTPQTEEKSKAVAVGMAQTDSPMCPECGMQTVPNGTCHKCINCGTTTGCS